MYVGHRLLRTKFLPLFCSGVDKKVDITSGRLMKFSRYVPHKRKIPPTQRSDGFCRVNRRQNRSGVLRGGTFFLGNHLLKVVVITVRTTTFLAGFEIKGIMEVQVRQYSFAKFITVKRQK